MESPNTHYLQTKREFLAHVLEANKKEAEQLLRRLNNGARSDDMSERKINHQPN